MLRDEVLSCMSCSPFGPGQIFASALGSVTSAVSMRGPTAIDRQCSSGDRGGRVTGEEHGQRANLLDCRKELIRLLSQQHVADHLVPRDPMRLGLPVDLSFD